jgi:YHS domain-containing protein
MNLIRLLIFALLLYIGYRLWKRLGATLFKPGEQEDLDESTVQSADLVQDPQCQIYFLKQRGIETRIKGQTVHFCSEKCRDEYLKDHSIR